MASSGRQRRENFLWPCDSLGVEHLRFVIVYFMNLDIQRAFFTALGADKEARRMDSALYLFSAKGPGTVQANVNME